MTSTEQQDVYNSHGEALSLSFYVARQTSAYQPKTKSVDPPPPPPKKNTQKNKTKKNKKEREREKKKRL